MAPTLHQFRTPYNRKLSQKISNLVGVLEDQYASGIERIEKMRDYHR